VAGSRHRLGTPFAIAVDCAIAACLALTWATSLTTVWLHVAYICVALSAFVRPSAPATVGRATLVSALGGAYLVRLHGHGDIPADDIVEIPLMTALAYCFALFVRQRRRAQQSIEDDRERLGTMIDGMPLAIVAFDGDGRVASWNRTAESLFGWRADEVIGAENPIVPPAERAASDRLLREIREGHQLQGLEVERLARDGSTLQLAVYSAPLGSSSTLVLYADAREQRRAQAERDEALASYQELIESLPLVTYVDEVDDIATNVYTSPQMEELLGWPLEEWARNPRLFVDILHPEDYDRIMNAVHDSNTTHEQFEEEYRLRHRDGHYVWVRDHSSILDDAGPRPLARGYLLDITEQKRLEEQLLQAQKMEAVGQFAGGIAHDFNNLLTGISGYAELAAGAGSTDPLLVRSLEGIRTASAEAASLTAQLLTFSRRDVPERRLVDANTVLREAAVFLDRLVRADVRVELALADELPPVSADATQLKQVVLNLALNARDAMPDGGTLTLETATEGEEVAIRVRDTGQGMDEATRARAFEPFFTTKAEGEGTGLGLAVAYGVVDALGGTLALRSAPGAGTVAEIVLPAAVGAAAELVGPRPGPPGFSSSRIGTSSVTSRARCSAAPGSRSPSPRAAGTRSPSCRTRRSSICSSRTSSCRR
jgi:two-component system, cell cycle sensor histidine kinase and response regulator CckA